MKQRPWLLCREQKGHNPPRVVVGNHRGNLSKAGWSWGWSQPLILRDEQSGLLTHSAGVESVSLCVPMKS